MGKLVPDCILLQQEMIEMAAVTTATLKQVQIIYAQFQSNNHHRNTNINWRTPWKNRICSTTTKLRKSLVKPVMWQKTCNY